MVDVIPDHLAQSTHQEMEHIHGKSSPLKATPTARCISAVALPETLSRKDDKVEFIASSEPLAVAHAGGAPAPTKEATKAARKVIAQVTSANDMEDEFQPPAAVETQPPTAANQVSYLDRCYPQNFPYSSTQHKEKHQQHQQHQ